MKISTLTADDISAEAFGGDTLKSYVASCFSQWPECQSPIEALMGADLEYMARPDMFGDALGKKIIVLAQHKIGRYRCDLALFEISGTTEISGKLLAVVECDGHDFHEKTKEQAKWDKARDRWFVSQNIRVFRFTGSEIYNASNQCAIEVMRALIASIGH